MKITQNDKFIYWGCFGNKNNTENIEWVCRLNGSGPNWKGGACRGEFGYSKAVFTNHLCYKYHFVLSKILITPKFGLGVASTAWHSKSFF